jgi:hypothetical protein
MTTRLKTLVQEMEQAWKSAQRHSQPPNFVCIPGGLWLRSEDKLVSYNFDDWFEPGADEYAIIIAFAKKLQANSHA